MADYYVDPSAVGDNDGGGDGVALDPTDPDNWTDAWTSLQSALNAAVAGDTVFCRGTQTLAASLDVDTNAGSLAGGFIKFVGCNSGTGAVDGSYFVIDANNAADNCLAGAGAMIYLWFENIELKNANFDGAVFGTDNDSWVWINCISHDNGNSGWDGGGVADHHKFIKCRAYNNTNHGFQGLDQSGFWFLCAAYNNTDSGWYDIGPFSAIICCISHDNGAVDYGFYIEGSTTIYNCIADTEVVGIYLVSDRLQIIGNRITNCTTSGLDFGNELGICGWNLFESNTADLANPAAFDWEGVYAAYITDESTTNTNKIDPDSGDDGYHDHANNDFNLDADATYVGDGDDTVGLNYGNI